MPELLSESPLYGRALNETAKVSHWLRKLALDLRRSTAVRKVDRAIEHFEKAYAYLDEAFDIVGDALEVQVKREVTRA